MTSYSLPKSQRLTSRRLIDELFSVGSRSLTIFPLRAVYRITDDSDVENAAVKVMFSVPKRLLKRAVMRNRVKRQMREAYRHNKASVMETASTLKGKNITLALIWMDSQLHDSNEINEKVSKLLCKIEEKISFSAQ